VAASRQHRDRALAWILWNQAATPGLGTWLAGRRAAGIVEMALALAGFLLFCAFFAGLVAGAFREFRTGEPLAPPPAWLWRGGLGLFGVAWGLALASSVRLWREAGRRDRETPPRVG
jgi:hypothetical protein